MTASSGLALQFLGTGDAFGSGGRFQTCLRLSGPEGSVLVDCGASSLMDYRTVAAQRDRLRCRRLILTHMSPDMLTRGAEDVGLERAEDGQVVAL